MHGDRRCEMVVLRCCASNGDCEGSQMPSHLTKSPDWPTAGLSESSLLFEVWKDTAFCF